MIIDFLESGDDELIAGALHTIANVASSEEVQQQIIELGGVPNIIKLMNSINVMIQKGATTAIANLVANRTFVVECVEWSGVVVNLTGGLFLVLLLLLHLQRSTTKCCSRLACWTRWCCSPKSPRTPKCSSALLRLSTTWPPIVRRRRGVSSCRCVCCLPLALTLLVLLAETADVKQPLKDAGAVQPLKSLARSRDPEIKREAIEALAELGITYVSAKKAKAGEAEAAETEKRETERIARERAEEEQMRQMRVREAQERDAAMAIALERERAEREKAESVARERQMREAQEREAALNRERERLERERAALIAERERDERVAQERQLQAERDRERAQRESAMMLERERQDREALERQKAELERLKREQEAELEAQRRRQIEAMEAEARRAQEELDRLRREKDDMERAAREAAEREAAARAMGGSSSALKMVKMTEVIEIEEDKDVDEDYEEEDDEMTDDDRRGTYSTRRSRLSH